MKNRQTNANETLTRDCRRRRQIIQ